MAHQRVRDEFSPELATLYNRRREINVEIEALEKNAAKVYYESMQREVDNMMHGIANTELNKELDFYYNSYNNSPDATFELMKRGMQQHMLAYEIFDKIPYEKWDKYFEAIYEQCDLLLDSSIEQDEFDGNRWDIIDEANE
ncbi:hypothetical protein EhV281 [Emiliania huxleyi virus 86]|uniref:Uncharacterized protein n=1 Tax=Emiliania huxleyi virus 86 (isolate United Kingdom/English Channel/1999) TaxID=654925 RepID=Q4A2J9_EHV8U|nr:hypothetical protein EhV281 [Emiliania huxleyi virus 86]AEP15375.1 hypothetical protein EOVG_00438 [Emiliania huxleyi virus 88]AHA54890.1 hypothetical protein EhV145_00340 [Emiliania huxleyi virus 145]AHA55903.1 hypothetical protein EhV164_00316 [Emiliania huxleyi virus 164]CAI65707.1 hypothetical protein EhV281 [Emiliania huxleyi virus 86]